MKYFGDWDDSKGREQIRSDFSTTDAELPSDEEILFAWYSYEDYSGNAFVLFERGAELFEVNGGHCSCHGLEGQWEPRSTTWSALAMRKIATDGEGYVSELYGMDKDARAALLALISEKVTNGGQR